MLKRAVVYIVSIILIFLITSCTPLVFEEKAGAETGRCLITDKDGGYIIAGRRSLGQGLALGLLIKTDQIGNAQWTQTFGKEDAAMEIYSLHPTDEGGFVLAGYLSWNQPSDAFLLKTDSGGNQEWLKTFGGSDSDYVYAMQPTRDGGFILGGYTYSVADRYAAWLIKTDSQGKEEWSKIFEDGNTYTRVKSLMQTEDGGFLLAGSAESSDYAQRDAWIVKTDHEGNKLWSRLFGEKGQKDHGYAIRATDDGGIVFLMGGTPFRYSARSDFHLVKIAEDGHMQWSRVFESDAREMKAYTLHQADDGGFLLTGTKDQGSIHSAFIIKTDAHGKEQWRKLPGGQDQDTRSYDLASTDDGVIVLIGSMRASDQESSRVWLIKTDQDGSKQWVQLFGEEYIAAYRLNPLLNLSLLLLLCMLLLHSIGFFAFCRDMKKRAEKRKRWFVKFLFLGPFASVWYVVSRNPLQAERPKGSSLHRYAKNFLFHWSIYVFALPGIAVFLTMLVRGPGFLFIGILAVLIGTGFTWFFNYILFLWLLPMVIAAILTGITFPRKRPQKN